MRRWAPVQPYRLSRTSVGAAVTLAIVFVAGFALGAITITKGTTELSNGNHSAGGTVTFWSISSVEVTDIPATVPPAASVVVNPATVLTAANQSYVLNAATAGHDAVLWNFTEALGATLNAELELVFVVVNGSVPVTTTLTVYLQTQAAAPTGPFTISLYYDAGPGPLLLVSETQITNQCVGLHNCP